MTDPSDEEATRTMTQEPVPPAPLLGRKESPKKRRHSVIGWEDLARRGNRFKSFLHDVTSDVVQEAKRFKAIQGTTTGIAEDQEESSENTAPESSVKFSHLNKIVEEQTVENMQLRRNLEHVQSERTTLETTQKSLQDEVNYWKNRHARTSEALRIAEKNASSARSDADVAETTTAQLASTLQGLQTVVSETKLASRKLAEEQALVDQKASNLENKYLTQQQELNRIKKEAQTLRQTNALFEHARDQWKHERKTMELKVKSLKSNVDGLERQLSDQQAVEELRKQRATQDQAELRRVQTLLAQSTQQHETNLQVQQTLQETIQKLEKTNQELHEKLMEQQETARIDSDRLSNSLTKSERETQKLRLDKEALEEEVKRTKLDKEAVAKQVQELKQRVVTAERNHHMSTPKPASLSTATPSDDTENQPNKICFQLPPLPGSAKSIASSATKASRNPDVLEGKSCCICFKPSFGIMKSCPCGECHKRAHIMCVKQVAAPPSVSHPGTPAIPAPVILCKLNRLSAVPKNK